MEGPGWGDMKERARGRRGCGPSDFPPLEQVLKAHSEKDGLLPSPRVDRSLPFKLSLPGTPGHGSALTLGGSGCLEPRPAHSPARCQVPLPYLPFCQLVSGQAWGKVGEKRESWLMPGILYFSPEAT